MTTRRRAELRWLEGRRVNLCLKGGSRLDDCQLVSAGGRGVASLWLFTSGVDTFVRLDDVVDLWEAEAPSASRVA
jgi:hypothetical protein